MISPHNERLFQIYDYLKETGKIKNYVRFGEVIGENKAGVSDLKMDRKKANLDHFCRLKKSYGEINADFLLAASPQMILRDRSVVDALSERPVPYERSDYPDVIKALRETIASKNETIDALRKLLDQDRK